MKPLRPRYARIERLVIELLGEMETDAPPVPVEDIVRAHGIEIHYGDLEDVSGLIMRDGDNVTIGVNEDHARTRQRFTIAHEFGHFLLHAGETLRYDKAFRVNYRSDISSQAIDIEEIEANFFAASLLMPRSFLEKEYEETYIDLDDGSRVADLAKKYRVSSQAMNLRLLNLFGHLLSF